MVKIKFRKESIRLATPGLYRTGFWEKIIGDYTVTVTRNFYRGSGNCFPKGTSYDIIVSSLAQRHWRQYCVTSIRKIQEMVDEVVKISENK